MLVYGLVDDLLTQARLHGREVRLTNTKAADAATSRLVDYTENLFRETIADRNADQSLFEQLSSELNSDEQLLAQAKQGLATESQDLATLNSCVTGVQQAVNDMEGGNQQAAISAISAVANPCESLQGNTPGGPVYPFDFPDPDVIDVAGTYFAYGTNSAEGNIQIITSTDLSHWTPVGNALPTLPTWATPNSTWAPSVMKVKDAYLLYYAVNEGPRECISVATASQPQGPFSDPSTSPLECQTTLGGSIDPAPYEVASTLYLTWKSNGASGQPATIWAEQLVPRGTSMAPGTTPTELLQPSQPWEQGNVEAPFMWQQGSSYFLFYSGSNWDSSSYAEGVATCDGPLGPCTKPLGQPIYATQSQLVSPGGGSVFTDSQGNTWIALHAYLPGAVGYPNARLLFLRQLTFSSGVPQVVAPG
jgi:beta-xylosidase